MIDSMRRLTPLRPSTPEEQGLVFDQLSRILGSPFLNQSQRYSRLLRYLVQKALSDGGAPLKERIVGAEVFGREPGYDTTADPVVRTTTAQLRRRLAQYYCAVGREQEIVIELPPRGYLVEFYVPQAILGRESDSGGYKAPSVEMFPAGMAMPSTAPALQTRSRMILAASVAVLSIGLYGIYRGTAAPSGALSKFWQPVLNSPEPTLIGIGRPSMSSPEARDTSPTAEGSSIRGYWRAKTPDWPPTILPAIVATLKSNGHEYHIGTSDTITPADVAGSSVVMIGALNNQWTMKLSESLRFHYGSDHRGKAWIEDTQNPAQRLWAIDFNAPFSSLREDYGIIARFTDPKTKRPVVLVSGIVGYGTKVAGDFVTSDRSLDALADIAPRGWERKSLQIVFSTEVRNGKAGTPRILATHFW